MKIKKSPLILNDFYVLDSKYKFNDPGDKKILIKELFDSYDIELDFMTKNQKSGEIFFFTKLSINNQDNPKAGYIIFVEGVSIFNFDNDSVLNEKEKADLIYLSCLSIAINNLRAFISNLTSSFPLGKYQIPTIDIIALHSEKKKQMKIKRKNNS